ncbi:MAG: hypothetical protein H0X68_00720 [Chloroflexi bacterium]|nr:hypothetical protein [Chloroflexota bacterium]
MLGSVLEPPGSLAIPARLVATVGSVREDTGGFRMLAVVADYFPEPLERDDTWGEDEENPTEWLRRSTLPRAKSVRRALNENLRHFEDTHAASLAKKLRHDWKSYYFELLVGRFLQVLGGEVEHEPRGSNEKRIDYRATLPDGVVCVEAVSKRMNLHAISGRAYVSNAEQRIRQAMRDPSKRAQARGASAPSILAIDGGVFGADLDQFDVALLGSTVQHTGFQRETVGFGFDAAGEMAIDPTNPWIGVLAFIAPGVFGATDPVLYLSPHYRGHVPMAFFRLERRMLTIEQFRQPAAQLMDAIRFAEPLQDESS